MPDHEFISLEEALDKTENVFIRLDGERSAQMEKIRTLQQISQSAQERERDRLTTKYGESSLQVKQAEARINYNTGSLQNLNGAIDRAKVVVPPLELDIWRVHGLVLDENRKPLFNLTVAFYTKEGEWVRELGFACSDEKGYFVLDIPGPAEVLAKYQGIDLFLTITEKEGGKVLCQLPEPLNPALGTVDYQEVVKGETPCQEPPGNLGGNTGGTTESWVVRGRVQSQSPSRPLGQLTVKLFEETGRFDENLGSTVIDPNGAFRFEYPLNKFEKLLTTRPGVFLQVLAASGEAQFTSEAPIFPEVGVENVFDIKI